MLIVFDRLKYHREELTDKFKNSNKKKNLENSHPDFFNFWKIRLQSRF